MPDHRAAWRHSVALHIGDATMKIRDARGEPARGRRGYWRAVGWTFVWGLAATFAVLAIIGT